MPDWIEIHEKRLCALSSDPSPACKGIHTARPKEMGSISSSKARAVVPKGGFEGLEVLLVGAMMAPLLLLENPPSFMYWMAILFIVLTAIHELYTAPKNLITSSHVGESVVSKIAQQPSTPEATLHRTSSIQDMTLTCSQEKLQVHSCDENKVREDDKWARYGRPSSAVIKPEDEDFVRRREEFRKTLIVPGVSDSSAFDARRQELAAKSLSELRKMIQAEFGSDPAVTRFLTDVCCYRFLRAREGNPSAAMVMIRATIDWRKKKGLLYERVVCRMCRDINPRAHAYFFMGLDVYNRAVMYSSSARAIEQKDAEAGMFHMVTEMEQQLDDVQNVAQIVWVVDFQGFNASHANPRLGIDSVHLFQQVYPERLGQLVLLGFPLVFKVFFKICAPLLDPVTRNKIVILRSEDERQRYYQEHWTETMKDWIKEVECTPAKPGSFPESSVIHSRYWQ